MGLEGEIGCKGVSDPRLTYVWDPWMWNMRNFLVRVNRGWMLTALTEVQLGRN